MITLIRTLARLAFAVLTITLCLPAASSRAQNFTFFYVSATGSGTACTLAQPCSAGGAVLSLALPNTNSRIVCLSPVNLTDPNTSQGSDLSNANFEMDCPLGTYLGGVSWSGGSNTTVKFRNVTFTNLGLTSNAIQFDSSGTLILENCIFETAPGTALDIEPTGPLNLVIKNSRISNNAAGVVIKPFAGGSVTAAFNGVTIADNTGGGMKTDTTNGLVSVDISNSTITNNAGNGLNAVSGAGGANILNIHNSVIARNGTAGVQANGANAAALIDMTLLDSNASGALTTINGGRILTYGNNRIVGSAGSGFTGPTPLQ
jgi:Right handed beta helix region